ncbi:MAG: hypothetical protein IT221_03985 [Fluviicola sp.]|nr:hypothetical protein [Fluviicola sp.]
MIYKIYKQDSDTLLEQPETGMGYQIISTRLYERYTTKKMVVYNTRLAVDLDENFELNKKKIINEGYEVMLSKSQEIMLETDSIKVILHSQLNESVELSTSKKILFKRYAGGMGATDNPKENASGIENFVRLSAFEDDRRIDIVNMKLKPGSFATTENDYRDCLSQKDDPVDRYALPNDNKIEWAFYIRPKSHDQLQRGIVQPAFGHAGGGIEAYFENGTSNHTYFLKKAYGL